MFKTSRIKLLGIAAGSVIALAGSAWTMSAERDGEETMTIDVNVPLNEIQDGQFCQAYALVYNGTSPFTFTWDGEFTNSDGHTGPLGPNQIVNGNVSSSAPNYLALRVEDSSSPTHQIVYDTAWLNIGDYEYNGDCEA